LENQVALAKPMTDAEIKAQKIREALEKMKEAKMKKIYVKFFLDDNSTKGLLIDERWTVLETMKQLAQKLGILLTPEHAIVEEYPELHIRKFSQVANNLRGIKCFGKLGPVRLFAFCAITDGPQQECHSIMPI
jgi:hypothetical protein